MITGSEAIFKLLSKKIQVLEMSMKERLDEMIHEPVATKDPKDFLGLSNLVEAAVGASQGVVGGIDRSTYDWWQNKFRPTITQTDLVKEMRSFYNECSRGITHPDIIITGYDQYEEYEEQNSGLLRLHDTKIMDVGFDNLRFKGATILPNQTCPLKTMYFLNTEFLRLKLHSKRNFVMTPFITPDNQDARSAKVLVAGNMTINNSRFQGVLTVT